MADDKNTAVSPDDDHDEEGVYKPPPEKSLKEIIAADQEDESLKKYKEALLGDATKEAFIVGKYLSHHFFYLFTHLIIFIFLSEPNNPNRVIVKNLALMVEGRPDVTLDLTGNYHLNY